MIVKEAVGEEEWEMLERTTIVSFDTGGDDRAELFTSSPNWMAQMDMLVSAGWIELVEIIRGSRGQVYGKRYSFPQTMITIKGMM